MEEINGNGENIYHFNVEPRSSHYSGKHGISIINSNDVEVRVEVIVPNANKYKWVFNRAKYMKWMVGNDHATIGEYLWSCILKIMDSKPIELNRTPIDNERNFYDKVEC